MITEDKVTETFCIADDFCKFFDAMMIKYALNCNKNGNIIIMQPRQKVERMFIMILYYDSGYHCLKHFYLEKVCRHMRHFVLNSSNSR